MSPLARPSPRPVSAVQRRTVRLLFATQVVGGVGVAIGISVGALLAARLGGTGISGLAQSCAVVGGALLVVPVTRLTQAYGRRPALALAYAVGAAGAALVVAAVATRGVPLLFLGMLLFGGGTTAGLQARYAAVDLAEPSRRGRQLSVVVWAGTIGSVAAPNFAALADDAVAGLRLPPLAGPFLVSVFAFLLASVLLLAFMRPDPLLTARRLARTAPTVPTGGPTVADPPPIAVPDPSGGPATGLAVGLAKGPGGGAGGGPDGDPGGDPDEGPGEDLSGGPRDGRRPGLRDALPVVLRLPAARLGIVAVAVGHLVMVGVMAMTPVHLGHFHGDADVLRVVGIVLSLHIAGMYALAPVVGWLTDRVGRRAVVLGGAGALLAGCAVAGTAGSGVGRLSTGLVLLGLGWSGTMVAGSTLLSEAVPVDVRPAAQGLSDLVMGVAGAVAGALSGFVVQSAGYGWLNLAAAIAVLPLVALALRPAVRRGR